MKFKRLKIFSAFALLFCIFCSSGFSQTLTYSLLRSLRVTAEEDQIFNTNTDIKFYLEIPYTNPADVEIGFPDEIRNASLQTIRRTTYQKYNEKTGKEVTGTRIDLCYRFSKKGKYDFPALTVRIKNYPYQIPFNSVDIKLNPQEQPPYMLVEFEDGTQVSSELSAPKKPVISVQSGTPVKFTLYLQYGIQLIGFNSVLPKDSIFTQTKTHEIMELKYREKVFSDALVPVAEYEWIPLCDGEVTFPTFSFTALAFNGNKYELRLPDFFINVTPAAQVTEQTEESFFSDAFDYVEDEVKISGTHEVTASECRQLVELRKAEQNAYWFTQKRQRVAFEKSLGLPNEKNEFPIIIFYLSILFFVIFLIILCIFIIRKETLGSVFSGVLIIISVIFVIYSFVAKNKLYAVTLKGELSSIPEAKAESKVSVSAGNRVEILEKTDGWVYIQVGTASGWCPESNVIYIR